MLVGLQCLGRKKDFFLGVIAIWPWRIQVSLCPPLNNLVAIMVTIPLSSSQKFSRKSIVISFHLGHLSCLKDSGDLVHASLDISLPSWMASLGIPLGHHFVECIITNLHSRASSSPLHYQDFFLDVAPRTSSILSSC